MLWWCQSHTLNENYPLRCHWGRLSSRVITESLKDSFLSRSFILLWSTYVSCSVLTWRLVLVVLGVNFAYDKNLRFLFFFILLMTFFFIFTNSYLLLFFFRLIFWGLCFFPWRVAAGLRKKNVLFLEDVGLTRADTSTNPRLVLCVSCLLGVLLPPFPHTIWCTVRRDSHSTPKSLMLFCCKRLLMLIFLPQW